jgi:hypothetical protein
VVRHPDRFATFLAFGADDHISDPTSLFSGSRATVARIADLYSPRRLLSSSPLPSVAGWFESGDGQGGDAAVVARLSAIAAAAGIDHCARILPSGHHTFRVWRQAFEDALPWVMGRFELPNGARSLNCGVNTSTKIMPSASLSLAPTQRRRVG